MKDEVRRQLKAYYFAYKWANGDEQAKHLKLSYKNGWYYVNNNPVRLKTLQNMGKTLWFRRGFANALTEMSKEKEN